MNVDVYLRICADLANRLKHGELRDSRSGLYPRLGEVSLRVPQAAIKTLTFDACKVEMEIADSNLAEFDLPVIDRNGKHVGDAFEYAAGGVAAIEQLRARIEAG